MKGLIVILIAGLLFTLAYTLGRKGLDTLGNVPALTGGTAPKDKSFVGKETPQVPRETTRQNASSTEQPTLQGPSGDPPNY